MSKIESNTPGEVTKILSRSHRRDSSAKEAVFPEGTAPLKAARKFDMGTMEIIKAVALQFGRKEAERYHHVIRALNASDMTYQAETGLPVTSKETVLTLMSMIADARVVLLETMGSGLMLPKDFKGEIRELGIFVNSENVGEMQKYIARLSNLWEAMEVIIDDGKEYLTDEVVDRIPVLNQLPEIRTGSLLFRELNLEIHKCLSSNRNLYEMPAKLRQLMDDFSAAAQKCRAKGLGKLGEGPYANTTKH